MEPASSKDTYQKGGDTHAEKSETSIYDATCLCSDSFKSYVDAFQPGTEDHRTAESLQRLFNQWGAHMGVCAPVEASLDARLALNQNIKKMVIELLEMIQQNLVWVDDPEHNSEEERDETSPGISAVRAAIDRLFVLAVTIRRSTTRTHHLKEGTFYGEAESGCNFVVQRRYPHAKKSLCNQLGASIYTRGLSLQYMQQVMQSHSKQLAQKRANEKYIKSSAASKKLPRKRASEKDIKSSAAIEPQQPKDNGRPAFVSSKESSKLPSLPLIGGLPLKEGLPLKGKTDLSLRGRKVNFVNADVIGSERPLRVLPTMPKQQGTEPYVPCILCPEPLKFASLDSGTWRAHFEQDIKMYVCISEDCRDPLQYFAKKKAWIEHMQTRHTMDWAQKIHTERWFCDSCKDIPEFDDSPGFLKHMKTHHTPKLTDSKMQGRLRRNKRIATREPFACPLCACVPDSIKSRLDEKPYTALAYHIAEHLESLAYLSLSHLDEFRDHIESEKSTASRGTSPQIEGNTPTFSESSKAQEPLHIDNSLTGLEILGQVSVSPATWLSSVAAAHLEDFSPLPRTSLSEILNSNPLLMPENRISLQYQLAYHVWQLYDSDFIPADWSREMVLFEFKPGEREIAFTDTRILADFDGELAPLEATPPFAKILALSISLLEIEYHINIVNYPADTATDIEARILAAKRAFDAQLSKSSIFLDVRPIIGRCLELISSQRFRDDPCKLQDVLYLEVVRPLRDLYETRCDLRVEGRYWLSRQAPGVSTSLVISREETDDGSGRDISTPSTDLWFERLQSFNDIIGLTADNVDDSYSPVKIAILDSGLDHSYASHGSVTYHDFVHGANSVCQDNHGRGTDAFILLSKIYSDARIFVGRVYERDERPFGIGNRMAEAIDHAREKWEVDIIVMPSELPFGPLYGRVLGLEAIKKANAAGILVFAGDYLHGISCIFWMQEREASSRFMNDVLRENSPTFTGLGKDIVLAGKKLVLGTSLPAVMAAALAARIIDFSRQPDSRERIRRPERLKRVVGMASVFSEMTIEYGACRTIYPWRILRRLEDREFWNPETVSKARRHMCMMINRALDQV